MMEQLGVPTKVFEAYKFALGSYSEHEINGKNYSVPPLKKEEIYNHIYTSIFSEYNKKDLLSTSEKIKNVVSNALKFTMNNSELFCGVWVQLDDEKIIDGSIQELTEITDLLIMKKCEGINISESIKRVFSEAALRQVTVNDVAKGTRRGFETARLCHTCEQVDPIVGGMVHVTAGILSVINGSSGEFSQLWEENYSNAIKELSSPKTTGFVDILIKIVELNKEKFPNLDIFFGGKLALTGFEGTYYDIVNLPEYEVKK